MPLPFIAVTMLLTGREINGTLEAYDANNKLIQTWSTNKLSIKTLPAAGELVSINALKPLPQDKLGFFGPESAALDLTFNAPTAYFGQVIQISIKNNSAGVYVKTPKQELPGGKTTFTLKDWVSVPRFTGNRPLVPIEITVKANAVTKVISTNVK